MPAHAGIHGDQAKPAETLDPRIRGDDRQRGRPNGGDGAAVTRAPDTIRDGIRPRHGSAPSAGSSLASATDPFSELDSWPMKRDALVEKILDIKREKGWTWKHVTDEIG